MNTLKTFKLFLVPDVDFPALRRLAWEIVDVSLADVLVHGVHPWADEQGKVDRHPTMVDALLRRLNDASVKIPDLESAGYANHVWAPTGHYYQHKSLFEHTIEYLSKWMYFVDEMPYLALLDMARERLRNQWSHSIARQVAERVYPSFQDLRRFLRTKKRDMKLSGYDDLDRYDLGHALSLNDFEGRDAVVLNMAFPFLNFRRATFLRHVTYSHGLLKLVPEITRLTLTTANYSLERAHLEWHVERKGDTCSFKAAVGASEAKRAVAREFAEAWRIDNGRLCFRTSLDRLFAMVEQGHVAPSFPSLNYTNEGRHPAATAELRLGQVECYQIGSIIGQGFTGEQLKNVLRMYGVSSTGDKATLFQKIATLAAAQYQEHRGEMDHFFGRHQFVRMERIPGRAQAFPLLEDCRVLRNLLLTAYALRHMRGNAILHAAHENTTFSVRELMQALLDGRMSLAGAFLRVT
ncbi:MAG: hypothetical protein IT365_04515 [Candidatus Hydrogenedentes bacterium]|nr:hypothetical protein [Candidatus Hydrogenedentota bacterium]